MKEFFSRISAKLFGDPKLNSLEHRLFNTVTLVNGIINIIGSVGVFYLDNFLYLLLLQVGTGIVFLFLYWISRFRGIYYVLYWPFLLTIVIFLSFNWFSDGGSLGGAHYYFIPALVIGTVLIRNHNILFVYLFFSIVVSLLFYFEFENPEWVTALDSRKDRFLDVSTNYIFVQILVGILIFILARNLNQERAKSDNLLLNILPQRIAEELKKYDTVEPQKYECATVLFTDMAGFTKIAEKMTPNELVSQLDESFSQMDQIAKSWGLEKIKTIGDAYMAASGIPEPSSTHAVDAVLCALAFQRMMKEQQSRQEERGEESWKIRLGIHSGSLVAGVIGHYKFAYDIWGDTVNTASRMESSGLPGEVNISQATYELIKDFFSCEYRGKVQAKNKGEIDMFLVKGILPELRKPGKYEIPNDKFAIRYDALKSNNHEA